MVPFYEGWNEDVKYLTAQSQFVQPLTLTQLQWGGFMLILGRRLCAYICRGFIACRHLRGLARPALAPGLQPQGLLAEGEHQTVCVWHADHQGLLRGPGVLHFAWKGNHRTAQRSKELMLCAEMQRLPSRKHWRGRDTNCQRIARPYSLLVPPQSLQQSRELDGGCPYHAAHFFSLSFSRKPTREPGRGERPRSSGSTGTQCQYTS